MAWVTVDKDGSERIFEQKPRRFVQSIWVSTHNDYRNRFYDFVELPKGSIKKLIGRELSWSDEPVELKGD